MSSDLTFLESLLDAAGPSGFEVLPARVWRKEAERFAADVRVDVSGNSYATVNPEGSPRVMLAGHIDEIGLQITHIDKDGFLFVAEIGGWDTQVLVGQRVKILTKDEPVTGVIGKKAIHLIEPDDRSKASKTKSLWVDVGAGSRDEVTELFRATYGRERAPMWVRRWRVFFMACAELFGAEAGEQWGVAHYRFRRREPSAGVGS